MSQNLQKKPSKGILKTSRSVDNGQSSTSSANKRQKEMKFDEMNIMETFHPADKDYGHMRVDEPKTPYSEAVDVDVEPGDELDANILAAKLAASMNKPPRCLGAEREACSSDEEDTDESRRRRHEFEKKRKLHYNEFQALQLARQLLAQEEDEDEDDEGVKDGSRKKPST